MAETPANDSKAVEVAAKESEKASNEPPSKVAEAGAVEAAAK